MNVNPNPGEVSVTSLLVRWPPELDDNSRRAGLASSASCCHGDSRWDGFGSTLHLSHASVQSAFVHLLRIDQEKRFFHQTAAFENDDEIGVCVPLTDGCFPPFN